ncbi:hypothetical protein IT575_14425 [bacterium]|nr:hypothetical protein [bacterium]
MTEPLPLAPDMSAAKRLSDALRYIESIDVRFNIGATSIIIGGLVMNSYTPLIDMWSAGGAPMMLVFSWVAAAFAALICNRLLNRYYDESSELSRHMEENLLREGMFVRAFDQLFAEEAPRTLWGKALRSRRSMALSSDSLVTRIVALVRHYHFLCRKMGLSPRPRWMQSMWNQTRFWLALTLLSGPLLLLLGLLSGSLADATYMSSGNDIFGTLYMLLDEMSYGISFLPQWMDSLTRIILMGTVAYFVLLWPALRLLPVIERAILRRVMHDIVEYNGKPDPQLIKLDQAERDLTALRERVEQSAQEMQRKSIRIS